MRLRMRLVVLILATMVPLLAYSATTQFVRYRTAEQRTALGQARSMAHAVQQAVDARFAALRVLALSRDLQTGDFASFRKTAEVVIDHELPGANVLVLTADARQLVNTAAPPGTPLPSREYLESLRRLFETGEPVLSDLFFGALLRRPVVAIEVPVKGPDGTVIYDLALNPTPRAFLDPISGAHAADSVTTVYDRQGVVVARSQDHEDFLGSKAVEPLLSNLLRGEETMLRMESTGGADTVVALGRVDPFGWTVAVEIPSAKLSADALRSLLPMLAVGGLMVLLSAVLSLFAAQRIAGPIDALRNMAEEPSRGDWKLLARLPEVHDVALTLKAARVRVREHTADLERTLGERNLLVREVYHRVKNNLQMVDSMLAMQSRHIADPAVLDALTQLRNRVHALAVVHAQLMTSRNLKSFDASEFLKELAGNLSAAVRPSTRGVPITVEADSVAITLDIAIPMGLLLTELITNSAKHAGTDAEAGIRVRFRVPPERRAQLTVEDNGLDPAAPDRFAASADSLGAKLVKGFVRQLDGTMSVEYARGMRVTIEFPLPEDTQ